MNRMPDYEILRVDVRPELIKKATLWFHQKWGIPEAAYQESMAKSLKRESVIPRWYLVLRGETIIAGAGVIENDFHSRRDLSPNVCAVYVEKDHRKRGIAGAMLQFVCEDCRAMGIDTLYLLTDHTSFYERYGWEFLCMVQGDGEPAMARMYVHQS